MEDIKDIFYCTGMVILAAVLVIAVLLLAVGGFMWTTDHFWPPAKEPTWEKYSTEGNCTIYRVTKRWEDDLYVTKCPGSEKTDWTTGTRFRHHHSTETQEAR